MTTLGIHRRRASMTDLQRPDSASQRDDLTATTSDDRTPEEVRQKLVELIEHVRFNVRDDAG
jgi:hypothetical protein